MNKANTIKEAYFQDFDELEEVVWKLGDITLIELGTPECEGIRAFAEYMEMKGFPKEKVGEARIIFNKNEYGATSQQAEACIATSFPTASTSVFAVPKVKYGYDPDVDHSEGLDASNGLFTIFLQTNCEEAGLEEYKDNDPCSFGKRLFSRIVTVSREAEENELCMDIDDNTKQKCTKDEEGEGWSYKMECDDSLYGATIEQEDLLPIVLPLKLDDRKPGVNADELLYNYCHDLLQMVRQRWAAENCDRILYFAQPPYRKAIKDAPPYIKNLIVTLQIALRQQHWVIPKIELELLEEIAEVSPMYMCNLAVCKINGWGCKKDLAEAERLLLSLVEKDDHGHVIYPQAYKTLGILYTEMQEYDKAIASFDRCLKLAIEEESCSVALHKAAALLRMGKTAERSAIIDKYSVPGTGCKKCSQLIGYDDEKRFCPKFLLAQAFEYDDDTATPNYAKALEYYMEAAKQGDAAAQYRIGHFYATGKGVEKNIEVAKEWLLKSANQNFAMSQLRLYFIFEEEGNITEAVRWLAIAANTGDARAQFQLARFLLMNGFPRAEAGNWCIKSAEQGYAEAQWLMSVLLRDSNPDESVEWLKKAAAQGHEESIKQLKELEKDDKTGEVNQQGNIPLHTEEPTNSPLFGIDDDLPL